MLKVKVKLRLKFFNLQCYHGQKSLGQSKRNFNSKRFTSYVAKSSAVFLQIHVPSPLPIPNTMLKDQRNCALTVSTLSVGWGEEGRDVQC